MITEKSRADALTEAIMEQAQVYASAWSLIGGPFDDGNALETAEQEKAELRNLVGETIATLEQPPMPVEQHEAAPAAPRTEMVGAAEKIAALIQPNPPGELGPTDEPESQYRFGYNTAIEDALIILDGEPNAAPPADAAAAPADERAALTSGGCYFVYDPAGNYFERFDTDTERDAAHRDAINEYHCEAQYDQEWSEDVDQIISGIVTHTTGELKVDEGCYDYAPRAAAAQPAAKPTEAEILDLIYECNLGGSTEQQAIDFANRLLDF